jgi:hypothetical protein
MKIIYHSFHSMLTEFELLPPTVYRFCTSYSNRYSIRLGWYMLRKNLIIQNSKHMKHILSKTIKEVKDCVSVAYTCCLTGTLAESNRRVLLVVLVACVVGKDPIPPSNSLLQLVASLFSCMGTSMTVERSLKTCFSRILGSYIISTYIQFTQYCLPIHIG